ncbi:AhpD-like protein [Glarea lozoyensis ATCC 20868]|uniref:AhpD-like protein n=1 Tax=Glarea lozoyensis (strain ATCC 20868 / MF5171) TaxID=1116229 RepID=S3E568_GLAL2|nr:AhpD-like protein [Glarea lozoyensis ATCC 20868]EPE33558.1 AhpD-like protein [Glarea lozoyensis ATCC 20868]
MTSYTPPTEQDTIALLQAIEAKFPHKTLGSDKWYLVALSALVSVEPEQIATLYTYLINKPEYATSEARKALIRRIREALVKGIAIHGVCKPIEGIISIVQVERPEDKDYSCSRENWVTGPENLARGENWLNQIYKGNLSASTDNFLAHRDFDFISRHITYGFYLSDHTILGPIETELVVLSGIMIQNLPKETAWHFRGIRRVGVSQEDVESVHQCVELVAKYGRVSLHKVPRMADVEHEV